MYQAVSCTYIVAARSSLFLNALYQISHREAPCKMPTRDRLDDDEGRQLTESQRPLTSCTQRPWNVSREALARQKPLTQTQRLAHILD
jgi:hypothetical protein